MNKTLYILDLFSGIGGFSLGLERAGMKTLAFCEINPYCQKILKKHWPNVPIYTDIKELNDEKLKRDGIRPIDVICGGFPCQDISTSGKQKGLQGKNSSLWTEFHRIIGEVRPKYAIVENVTNLISGDHGKWMGRILGDLAEVGYDAQWHCIPACDVGAPHRRDRVWIVAYPGSEGICQQSECGYLHNVKRDSPEAEPRWNEFPPGVTTDRPPQTLAHAAGQGLHPRHFYQARQVARCSGILSRHWAVEPEVGRVADGIPGRVDRLRALGNAVVPQIPQIIGNTILQMEETS